jgi:putative toxin-antitoxin system antitoxin component (TIGR02293 family)
MYPVEVGNVTAALGGAVAVGSTSAMLIELAAVVAQGLPGEVVPALAANAAPDETDARRRVAALITSASSLKRRDRRSPAASERAERLAGIVALAQQARDDADLARVWLSEPHPLLAASRPIEVSATDLGARQVERILHNIEHDLPV